MSTNATIALTKDNELWYYDQEDGSIVLEFSYKHIVEHFGVDGVSVTVKPNTPLYDMLASTKFAKEGQE